MIDLETRLRDALSTYADSVDPSAPGDLADLVARHERSQVAVPRATGGWFVAAAAAVLVAALVPVLVLLRDRPAATTSVPTSLPDRAGTWQVLPDAPLAPRKLPSVVWTGDEFVVWGGSDGNPRPLADGAEYDPATRTWRTIAPTTRAHPGANAVWAGDRMVVLAGDTGDAYDPVTDSWSPLPTLDLDDGATGFTDAVWAGDVLLGVGVQIDEPWDRAVLHVWALDEAADAWVPLGRREIRDGLPATRRLVSVTDQFVVYDPIPTDDGFVLWNGGEGGWRFRLDGGWTRLPALEPRSGRSLDGTAAVWLEGRLVAVASSNSADGGSVELAELGADGWSPLRSVADGWLGSPHSIAVDDRIAVLGVNGVAPGSGPLLVDVTAGTVGPLGDAPIDTTIDQGAAWSGEALFIWGGQTPTDDAERTTGDPGPISDQGAIWTP